MGTSLLPLMHLKPFTCASNEVSDKSSLVAYAIRAKFNVEDVKEGRHINRTNVNKTALNTEMRQRHIHTSTGSMKHIMEFDIKGMQ